MTETPLDFQRKQLGNRRRRLERLLGFALVVTLAVIFVALWKSARQRNTAMNAPVPLPRNVNRRLSGYTFTQSEKGLRIFTIHAAHTQSYDGGARTVLEDVDVTIFGHKASPRHDEIRTGRCNYENASGALACFGKASITLESQPNMVPAPDFRSAQPLFLETSDISYDPRHFVVETNAPVRFHFGPATGSAKGLRYSTQEGWLSLEKDVVLTSPLKGADARLSAGSLLYDKKSSEIDLRSPVEFTQRNRHLIASTGSIFLDAQNRVRQVALSGGVQGFDILPGEAIQGRADHVTAELDPAEGQVTDLIAQGSVNFQTQAMADGARRTLSAQQAQVHFSRSTHQPKSGRASGNFELVFEPSKHTTRSAHSPQLSGSAKTVERRMLSGSELQFNFGPGGTLTGASTVGPGRIELIPLKPLADRRTITAGQIEFSFDPQGRLQNLRGLSGTRILDQPAANGIPRETTADHLKAKLDPATGAVQSILQKGNFHFREGDRQGSASQATYDEQSQKLVLAGNPQLWNPDSRIRARHIVMDTGLGRATGWDHVQSIHFSNQAVKGNTLAKSKAESNPPLIVIADRVIVEKNQETAHYEGNVRAWQGADVVESPSLDINRKTQQVSSGKGVTTLLLEPASHPPKANTTRAQGEPEGTQPVIIHADRLVYLNLGREAIYQGHVQMQSGVTTIQCPHLEVYFSQASGATGAEVERAVATGGVQIAQAPNRHGHGEHAEYFSQGGRIVLTGGPPVVYDEQQGFITGERLTFFIHDASLLADGGKKSQTLSKRRIQRQ